ncbi:hypothetical protein CRM22_010489 [Opisthorchis felineus]|uniref:Ras-GEF domain-containing protein n=1 Tax=Opisthorchis felineus TaxID=147828 RepID=A0A4S2KY10_OPIFE|nr:hypothetical protein CRM22_010489 [Opisthorchis felineus]
MPNRQNAWQPTEAASNLPRACTLSTLFDLMMYESNALFQCSMIEAFLHTYRLFVSMEELRKMAEKKLLDTCVSEDKEANQKLFALNSLRVFLSRWLRPPHSSDFQSPSGLQELHQLILLLIRWHNILRPRSFRGNVGKPDWSSKYRDESPNTSGHNLLRCMFYGVDQMQLERAARKFETVCFLADSLSETYSKRLIGSPEKINGCATSPSHSSSPLSYGSSTSPRLSGGSDHSQPFGILDLEATCIANVLTAEDQRLFLDLRLPEMLLYARKKPAPSVMATIDHFNHTVTALQGSILRLHPDTMPSIRLRPGDSHRCDSRERGAVAAVAAWSKSRLSRHDLLVPDQQPYTMPEMTYKRARMIAFWIDVASELQRLNNLYSMQAVLTGLQTNAIHRLRQCWTVVGRLYPQHLRRFESMVALMSHENNYEKLRAVISKHLQSIQKVERARRKQRQSAKSSPHPQDGDPSPRSAPPTELEHTLEREQVNGVICERHSLFAQQQPQPEYIAPRPRVTLPFPAPLSPRRMASKPNKKFSSNLSVPGLIPYLGLYTHDLTYLNYASPDTKPLHSTTNDSVPHSASQPDIRIYDQPETSLIGSLANALDITSPDSDTNTSPIEKSISVNDVSDENNARRRIKIRIEREIHFPSGVIRIGPFYKPTLNDDENNNSLSKPQPEILVNFEKHYREGEFLKDLYLLQYTSRSYDLKVDEKYKCWLDSFPSLSEDEARQLSLEIEPAQDSASCMTWDSQAAWKSPNDLSSSLAPPKMASNYASCSKLTAISGSSPVTRPKSHSVSNHSSSRPSIFSHPYFNQETADNVHRASTTNIEPIGRKTPLSLRQKLTKSARYSGRQFSSECERNTTTSGSPVTDRRRSSSKPHRHSPLIPREFRCRSLSQPRLMRIRIRVTLDDPLYVSSITAPISKSWKSVGLGSTPNLHKSCGENIPFEHSVIEEVSLTDSVSDVLFRVLTKFRVPDFCVSEFDLVELHPKNLNRILPTTANAYHELCSSLDDSAVKSTSAEDADILFECACVRRLKKVSMITSFRTRHPPFTVIASPRPNKRTSQQSDRIRGSVVAIFPPDP